MMSVRGRFRAQSRTSRSTGQALSFEALQGDFRALHIINLKPDAIAVAEIELGEIPMQMGFR
jgi:hypothetical protein